MSKISEQILEGIKKIADSFIGTTIDGKSTEILIDKLSSFLQSKVEDKTLTKKPVVDINHDKLLEYLLKNFKTTIENKEKFLKEEADGKKDYELFFHIQKKVDFLEYQIKMVSDEVEQAIKEGGVIIRLLDPKTLKPINWADFI